MITRLVPIQTHLPQTDEDRANAFSAVGIVMSVLLEDGTATDKLKSGRITSKYLVQNLVGDNIGTIGEIEGELYYFKPSEVTDDLDWEV